MVEYQETEFDSVLLTFDAFYCFYVAICIPSMSHNELLPLFPSALHPAIPVASQILSTLRGLTAPGRGNNIKPEERAALVGVAALLGCESKDLLQSSAQKACSVSPAHFRSALATARRLLRTVDLPDLTSSPTRRSSRASSSTKSPSKHDSTAEDPENAVLDPLSVIPSPFNTPKKKFKYSSGLDISDLMRTTPKSKHEPTMSSPLRHSVTPSKRRASSLNPEEEGDNVATPIGKALETLEEEPEHGANELRTPSKRVKYGTRPGVDLEHVDVPPVISSSRKKREDASAFFALRPGSGSEGNMPSVQKSLLGRIPFEDGLPEVHTPSMRKKRPDGYKKPRTKRRRDWTFAEVVWDVAAEQSRRDLEKTLEGLPAWMEANDLKLSDTSGSLEEVLLHIEVSES